MKGSTLRAVGGRFSGGCVELANNLFPGNDFGWFGGMIRDQGGAETVHEMRKYANFGGIVPCAFCLTRRGKSVERCFFRGFFVVFTGKP